MRQGLVFTIIVLAIFCVPVMAYDWSTNPGDGSEANPYQISTPEQLMSIGSDEILVTKHYVLTNDIVFDPNNNPNHVFTEALIAPNTSPVSDFQGTPFSGSFNGNWHTIYGLKITGGFSYSGLLFAASTL